MTRRYRPANGAEGIEFAARFCTRCAFDTEDLDEEDGCPIAADALAYDVNDDTFPKEWVQDVKDGPRCTAFMERIPGQPKLDVRAVGRIRDAYQSLPRDPVTGRPVIA